MLRFLIPFALLICVCCKPSPERTSSADSLVMVEPKEDTTFITPPTTVQDSVPAYTEPAPPPEDRITIGFWAKQHLELDFMLEPFKKIYNASSVLYKYYDDLNPIHERGMTKRDSATMDSALNKSYELILRYKEQVKAGISLERQKGRIEAGSFQNDDESFAILRESPSTLLTDIDFTFLGGTPFIEQDPEIYKDPSGKPETHYLTDIPTNSNIFYRYAYSRHPGPIDITYGPPLNLYKSTIHVKEIGSLKHNLKNRIPVWFLTTEGAIEASFISFELKIASEYGCYTNYPRLEFACSKNIDHHSIIGVFMSELPMALENCVVMPEKDDHLLEYDIDGDGSADIARVISSHSNAAMGDHIMDVIWFVKTGDKWTVLDTGFQPECT